MVGEKYWYIMKYITYQYFFPTITYRYIMYFFRTFQKSTAPYKVHNMGLRYKHSGGLANSCINETDRVLISFPSKETNIIQKMARQQ
jgi:hypothetical protein